MTQTKAIILFDIDGTLLLTGGCGKIAFNRVFKTLFNENEIWDNIVPDGRTDFSLIRECFQKRFKRDPSPQEIQKVSTLYFEYLEQELKKASQFRLMPSVIPILEKLSQHENLFLGLATGNFKIAALHKLKRGAIDHFFSFGGFGCDSENRNELTQKAQRRGQQKTNSQAITYVIGDTIHDIHSGKSIGATTIAIPTGSTSPETLKENTPDHLIQDLSQLTQILPI